MSNVASGKSLPAVVFRRVEPADVPHALSARAHDALPFTQHHVGSVDGRDVVLLTIDAFPDTFDVREILTLREERRRGIGWTALAYAERLAREAGRDAIRLHAKGLDDVPTATLVAWYERAGFAVVDRENGLLVKALGGEASR